MEKTTTHIEITKVNTPEQSIKLTKRGKRVLKAAGIMLAGAGLAVGAQNIHESVDSPRFESGTHTHVVEPGDSLWSISNEEVEHGANHTGEVVEQIETLNPEATADGLQVGEVLEVPNQVEK